MPASTDLTLMEMLEGSPIGVAILSISGGQRLFVNSALVGMFGAASKEDLLSRDIAQSWVDSTKLECAFQSFQNGMPLVNFESERRRVDGSVCWILMNTQPVTYQGQDAGIVWHVDITDRKIAERQVIEARTESEKASRAKSEFLAHVSHELRTPLNSILGFSDILQAPDKHGIHADVQQEYARIINNSGRHLLGIINSILDISKIEAGEFKLDECIFDLDALLADTHKLLLGMADKSGISMTYEPNPGLPKVSGDERVIKQIVMNLLSNAIKFNTKGGNVDLFAATGENGGILITVRDTGIGIEPSDIQKVLEPFNQVRTSAHNAHQGTGLGLSLSKHLTELHDGQLHLSSEIGKGTEVCISLPPARTVIS